MISRITFLIIFLNQNLYDGTNINHTKVNRVHLTFVTFIDEYRSKSNNIVTSTTIKSLASFGNKFLDIYRIESFVNNLNADFFILAGIFLLVLIVVVAFLIFVMKNFGKFCCKKKKKVTKIKSDSALSGECGCTMRFRKNFNIPPIAEQFQTLLPHINSRNSDVLTKANQAINNVYIRRNSTLPVNSSFDKIKRIKGKVKSALVLISIEKNCNGDHLKSFSNENVNLIKKAYLDSEEDLNEYNEYSKKSLVNIRKELLELDQPNKRFNFKI
jgi:hypothetical protein